MTHKYTILTIFLFVTTHLVAQKESNIWYFGNGQGVEFNQLTPSALSDSFTKSIHRLVPATICDSLGNEVLFSNGISIRNGKTKNETLTSLFGISEYQTILNNYIIPNPDNHNEYFVFSSGSYREINQDGNLQYKGTSRYQRVRFTGPEKDSLIQVSPPQEFLNKESLIAAYENIENNFYWVAVYAPITGRLYIHKLGENGLAYPSHAYWLDTTGLNPEQPTNTINWNTITFSSDGSKLAFAKVAYDNSITLCNFDQKNGTISGIRRIEEVSISLLEFSYSGEFIYVNKSVGGGIYQCRTQFTNSLNLSDTGFATLIGDGFGSALIGPDKKIYLGGGSQNSRIGIIHFPDMAGLACGFDTVGIVGVRGTLPRYVLSSTFRPTIWSSGFCLGDSTSIQLFNLEADSAILDWGDGTTEYALQSQYSHLYLTQDSFKIAYLYFRKGVRDTFEQVVSIRKLKNIHLGNDSLICSGSALVLNLFDPDAENYQWNTNATDSAITVSQEGLYAVQVSNGQCNYSDSIEVFTVDCAIAVQKTCFGDTTKIRLVNSNYDSVMIDFGDGYKLTASDSIYYHRYSDSGTFTATISFYKNGLSREIIKPIRINKLPVLNLGADTILCSSDHYQYEVGNSGFDSYLWSDGNTTPSFTPDSSQEFWVSVAKNGCSTSDTAKVYIINCQIQIDSLCLNNLTKLSISEPALDSSVWDFGDGNIGYGSEVWNQYAFSGTFTGSLKVNINNLSKILPFTVDIEEIPKPFTDSSLALCYGQALELPFSFEKYQIDWSEGTQGIQLIPDSSGTYFIRIRSVNCQVDDSIQIHLNDCTCDNYTATGFSPNKDGLNETFIPMVSCEISSIHFWVYTRWGQNIFESESLTEGWDGTYLERPCEPGVYMYYCTYFNPLTNISETIKGTIHLVR